MFRIFLSTLQLDGGCRFYLIRHLSDLVNLMEPCSLIALVCTHSFKIEGDFDLELKFQCSSLRFSFCLFNCFFYYFQFFGFFIPLETKSGRIS